MMIRVHLDSISMQSVGDVRAQLDHWIRHEDRTDLTFAGRRFVMLECSGDGCIVCVARGPDVGTLELPANGFWS